MTLNFQEALNHQLIQQTPFPRTGLILMIVAHLIKITLLTTATLQQIYYPGNLFQNFSPKEKL